MEESKTISVFLSPLGSDWAESRLRYSYKSTEIFFSNDFIHLHHIDGRSKYYKSRLCVPANRSEKYFPVLDMSCMINFFDV